MLSLYKNGCSLFRRIPLGNFNFIHIAVRSCKKLWRFWTQRCWTEFCICRFLLLVLKLWPRVREIQLCWNYKRELGSLWLWATSAENSSQVWLFHCSLSHSWWGHTWTQSTGHGCISQQGCDAVFPRHPTVCGSDKSFVYLSRINITTS